MELKNYMYLALIMVSIAVPLLKSFDKRMSIANNLKYILPAVVLTSAFFLIWDINFTHARIWTFNSAYTLGKDIKGLPIEEWLFFPVALYSSIFVYEWVKAKTTTYDYTKPFLALSLVLMVGFALISYLFRQQIYTFTAFIFFCRLFGLCRIQKPSEAAYYGLLSQLCRLTDPFFNPLWNIYLFTLGRVSSGPYT